MSDYAPVGVIGTGQIGSRMAARLLQAGHQVVTYDRDPTALNALPAGVEPVESAAAVAAQCDLIITCVTDNDSVREAVLGPGGVIESIRPEHLVIETTTSTPATSRDVADALRFHGADLVDAPVSRGVPAAENGTLSIMVGGEAGSQERALPVLSVLGTDIIFTGRVGTGHIAKAMNMMVMAVNFVATMEAMHLAESHGIPRDESIAAFTAGPGRSFVIDHHWPRYILPERYDSGFTLGLMWKDLRIASEIAADCGHCPLLGDRVTGLYRWAAARGIGEADNTRLVEFTRQGRGVPSPGAVKLPEHSEFLQQLGLTLFGAVYLGTIEALAVARSAGLEPDRLLAVLNASSGGSRMSSGERDGVPDLARLHENVRDVSLVATKGGDFQFVTGMLPYLFGLAVQTLPVDTDDEAVLEFMRRLTGRSGSNA